MAETAGKPGLEALLAAIREGEGTRRPLLVALDGRCASGKTTLAEALCRRYGWSVVHMDQFFLRPEQRTPARYETPGGNIDHERFLDQVLGPLRAGEFPVYRPFDCRRMALAAPVRTAPAPVVLLEGTYACHPTLWDRYDLRAFLTVTPETQRQRLLARNGPAEAEIFQRRWIPLEERYFSAFQIPDRCGFCIPAEDCGAAMQQSP